MAESCFGAHNGDYEGRLLAAINRPMRPYAPALALNHRGGGLIVAPESSVL